MRLLRSVADSVSVLSSAGETFAAEDVWAGSIIDAAPVIEVLPGYAEQCRLNGTLGERMLIRWGDDGDSAATALGPIAGYSLVAEGANADLVADVKQRQVVSAAVRDIAAGERLSRQQSISEGVIDTDPAVFSPTVCAADPSPVVIAQSQWGWGGFAAREISRGEVIESAPVAVGRGTEQIMQFRMADWGRYYFAYGGLGGLSRMGRRFDPDVGPVGMSLGYGGVYNHSYQPNIRAEKSYADQLMIFRAVRSIAAGEQLLQNYGWAADDERFFV